MAEMSVNTLERFAAFYRRNNFARENRFEAIITPPISLMGDASLNLQKVSIMIENTALPGRTIGTSRLRINSLDEQRAQNIDFFGDAINFGFLVDDSWDVKRFFQSWQELMVDPQTREVGFYEDYIGEIELRALSIDETVTHSITLEECFPRSFQLIEFQQGANTVHRFVVAISFKRWRENPVDRSNLPSITTKDAQENILRNFFNSKIKAALKSIPPLIHSKTVDTVVLDEPVRTITRILGR